MALTVTGFRKQFPMTQQQAIKQVKRAAAAAARRALEWSREIDRFPIGRGPSRARGALVAD